MHLSKVTFVLVHLLLAHVSCIFYLFNNNWLVVIGSHVVLRCVLAGFGTVIWLPRLGGLPHSAAFTWRKLTPPKRATRTGWPGNPPWWGTPPNMWTWSRKKRDCMDRLVTPPRWGTSPAWGPPLPCEQALRSFFFFSQKKYRTSHFRKYTGEEIVFPAF